MIASELKSAVYTDITQPSQSLIKSICYPENNQFKSQATSWGVNTKWPLLKEYKLKQCKSYTDLCQGVAFVSITCTLLWVLCQTAWWTVDVVGMVLLKLKARTHAEINHFCRRVTIHNFFSSGRKTHFGYHPCLLLPSTCSVKVLWC